MIFYRLVISYKGTHYSGWQFQTENPNTVQEVFQKVVASIVNYQEFKVIGASRTDGGVHARAQVLKLELPKDIKPQLLLLGLNSKLPKDIKVISIEYIHESFNFNRDIKSKEYHYHFSNLDRHEVLLGEITYSHKEHLDISVMQQACELIKGEHDFSHFCMKTKGQSHFHRNIIHCSIESTSFSPLYPKGYYLKIIAPGFLKYMIRYLMGALLDIGEGKITLEEFRALLDNPPKERYLRKAPPHGLSLYQINFKDRHDSN